MSEQQQTTNYEVAKIQSAVCEEYPAILPFMTIIGVCVCVCEWQAFSARDTVIYTKTIDFILRAMPGVEQ